MTGEKKKNVRVFKLTLMQPVYKYIYIFFIKLYLSLFIIINHHDDAALSWVVFIKVIASSIKIFYIYLCVLCVDSVKEELLNFHIDNHNVFKSYSYLYMI